MPFSFSTILQNRRLPWMVIAALGLVATLYLVQLALLWPLPRPVSGVEAVVRIPTLPHVESSHLYGRFVENLENLPETQLQITLEGVVMLPDQPENDLAIISSPSTPAKAYRIGDVIPGDAELKKVMVNQVVILNQGQLQSLKLPIKTLPQPWES